MLVHKNANFLSQIIENIDVSVVVSDPHIEGHPLVYVNKAFTDLTGYSREECIGQNCRFLQGEQTDREAVARIKQAVGKGEEIRLELLNYTKTGSPFWNELNIYPVNDATGNPMNFIAMQFAADEKRAHKKAILTEMMKIMDL